MEKTPKHLMIVAGEASGDMHAAALVEAIRAKDSNVTFSGLGGPKMWSSGVELYEDMTKIAVVGFWEVLKHYGEFKRIFKQFLKKIDAVKPCAVVLVDYPGFNLRLAREIKDRGIPVIYYISPQVWAWKESRVQSIKDNVDKMLVLFEFEKKFYAKHGFVVDWVGHPLVDAIIPNVNRKQLLESIKFSNEKLTIGILPGSREKEIENLLPPMISAAEHIYEQHPNVQFLLLKAPTISMKFLENNLGEPALPLKIVPDRTYEGINASDICIVASGTATLETAILNKPMVVVYKTALLTWLIAKYLVKIKHIAMVNVVAGKEIVPECIQFDANGKKISEEVIKIFSNELKIAEVKSHLDSIRKSLGGGGASERAAETILEFISSK